MNIKLIGTRVEHMHSDLYLGSKIIVARCVRGIKNRITQVKEETHENKRMQVPNVVLGKQITNEKFLGHGEREDMVKEKICLCRT